MSTVRLRPVNHPQTDESPKMDDSPRYRQGSVGPVHGGWDGRRAFLFRWRARAAHRRLLVGCFVRRPGDVAGNLKGQERPTLASSFAHQGLFGAEIHKYLLGRRGKQPKLGCYCSITEQRLEILLWPFAHSSWSIMRSGKRIGRLHFHPKR